MCILTWIRKFDFQGRTGGRLVHPSHGEIAASMYIRTSREFLARLPLTPYDVDRMALDEYSDGLLDVFLYKISPMSLDTIANLLRMYEGQEKGSLILDMALGNWEEAKSNFYVRR